MNTRDIKVITSTIIIIVFSLFMIVLMGCSNDDTSVNLTDETSEEESNDDTNFEATDWTTETHSKDADPNFDEIFEDNTIKKDLTCDYGGEMAKYVR